MRASQARTTPSDETSRRGGASLSAPTPRSARSAPLTSGAVGLEDGRRRQIGRLEPTERGEVLQRRAETEGHVFEIVVGNEEADGRRHPLHQLRRQIVHGSGRLAGGAGGGHRGSSEEAATSALGDELTIAQQYAAPAHHVVGQPVSRWPS